MGKEIQTSHFSEQDLAQYRACLEDETALLRQRFVQGAPSTTCDIGGFETVPAGSGPTWRNTAMT